MSKSRSDKTSTKTPLPATARNTWLAGAAVTVVHFTLTYLLAGVASVVWGDLVMLAALAWLARKLIITIELPIAFAPVCIYIIGEPNVGFSPVVWICLLPFFALVRRERRLAALAGWGLWSGTLSACGIYAWVWPTLNRFFGMGWAMSLPLFALLMAVIGMQFAIFLPLARFLSDRIRWPLAFIAAPLFTLVEYWMPLPFPMALGMAFANRPFFLQPLSLAGLHGLSLICAIENGALDYAIGSWREGRARRAMAALAAAAAVIVLHAGYGWHCMRAFMDDPSAPSLDIAMIQPVAPLRVNNDESELQEKTSSKLKELSLHAASATGKRPDLLIWPEGAGSFASRTPEFNPPYMRALSAVQEATSLPLIVHNVDFVRMPGAGQIRYYSAISLIEPVARVTGSYYKNILMPFGECLPFEQYFPVIRKWFPETRHVLRGMQAQPLTGPGGRFAPLICFEVLYPEYVRGLAGQDCGYIVNLTNDGWYDRSHQPLQHLRLAVLRAIENRKPLVRATNSGISAFIDARGVIADGMKTNTMEEAVLRGRIYPRNRQSFFGRHGDVIHPWILTPLMLILLAIAFRGLWRERRQTPGAKSASYARQGARNQRGRRARTSITPPADSP
ncbi:MAG: apolipoprotein N-acyltransferase [Candidatus Sumerlaeota bacterium]|nr:apolipoprotein N-acyltransferase [Candidatus Sumerlaeota bacterium]